MKNDVVMYDAFGRAVEPAKKPDPRDFRSSVFIDRSYRYPSTGLTPRKLLGLLRSADMGDVSAYMELFAEMEEKDGHLGSILQTRRLAVASLEWAIEPFGQEKRDAEIAAFCKSQIDSILPFEPHLLALADGIAKGFASLEIGWGVKGGKNVIERLGEVEQRRWRFIEADDKPLLLTAANPSIGEEAPPWRFVFHVHKTHSGSILRQGATRRAVWCWLFKHYALKDWASYAELFGLPMRVGKYSASASTADKEALANALRLLGTDAAAIIPESMQVEFIETKTGGNTVNVFRDLGDFMNAEMSKAVLGHSSAADSTPGKLGGEQNVTNVSEMMLKFDAELIGSSLRAQLLRPLVGFNFGWDVSIPWFLLKWQPPEDEQAKATLYKTHKENGAKIPLKFYHETFGIPLPEEGEEILLGDRPGGASPGRIDLSVPALQGSVAPANANGGGEGALNAAKGCPGCGQPAINNGGADTLVRARAGVPVPPTPDAVDLLSSNLLERTDAPTGNSGAEGTSNFRPSLLSAQIDPVKKLMDECATPEEFRDRLFEAYAGMDTVQLADAMADGFALAELYGRYTAIADKSVRATGKGDA